MFLTCCGGWAKGVDEEDGFWEIYDSWTTSNLLITLALLVVLVLSAPVTLEFVTVMLNTMEDLEFAKNELPKIDGCLDLYVTTEVLARSNEFTNDQLIMHYISVSLWGCVSFFTIFHTLAVLIRRCIDSSDAVREYNAEMARIKQGNQELYADQDDGDEDEEESDSKDES